MTHSLMEAGIPYELTVPTWAKHSQELPYLGSNQHLSGQLREISDQLWNSGFWDKVPSVNELSVLLAEAAERLDDAHEEWLERRVKG